ncbi:histone protein [Streptomyces sp. HUAS 31]|uniref:histone protein n=1 Tax=Streptomyces TaxID=1883 RepID=UPI002305A399|nr:histone protein [Streptomyces sp. HUAS 31]WCD94246.1 histone protein [Streptomyces sp. HUAS 31]
MDDQAKLTLAAALMGGYVLGRTKKGRLALTVATYLAGRRFGLEPRQLVAEGMRRLGEVPQVAELQEQLRGEVLEAGRKAVTAAADRGMATLADTLSDRTARLRERDEDEAGEAEEEYEDEGGPEEEHEEEEEPEEPAGARAGRRGARQPSRSRKAPTTSAKKKAPAKRTAAKKTAAKKNPGKKTTAKKTTSSKRAASQGAGRRR